MKTITAMFLLPCFCVFVQTLSQNRKMYCFVYFVINFVFCRFDEFVPTYWSMIFALLKTEDCSSLICIAQVMQKCRAKMRINENRHQGEMSPILCQFASALT